MANYIKSYTLSAPGNAFRLHQDLSRDATLSGSSTSIVYVTVNGTAATVVRDTAITIQAEIDAEQTAIDTHAGNPGCYEAVFLCEDPPKKGRKVRDQWFETDNGDGTYSDLAKDVIYNYSGKRKESVVTTTYYKDGATKYTDVESYHTLSGGAIITKNSRDEG